jgi:hypothetical protein
VQGQSNTRALLTLTSSQGPFVCGTVAPDTHSLAEWAWLLEQPDQFPSLAPSYTDGNGDVVGPYLPDFNFADTIGATP